MTAEQAKPLEDTGESGSTLPVFVSPNVLQILVGEFNISPISIVEEDLKKILD